jgi:peptide deformylase
MRMERNGPVGSSRGESDFPFEGQVRPIVRMPEPLLRRVARPCSPIDPDVLQVAADLLRTMQAHPGCRGLSAPQIGRLMRIVAVDVAGDPSTGSRGGPLVLVNPQLVVASGIWTECEGCVSIPNVVANVRRANRVLVVASSFEGGTVSLETSGLGARVLLHELDHLDGVVILDRLRSLSDLSPAPGCPSSSDSTAPAPADSVRRTSA